MSVHRATADDLPALLPLAEGFSRAVGRDWEPALASRALQMLLTDDAFGFILLSDEGYVLVRYAFSPGTTTRDAALDEVHAANPAAAGALIEAAADRAKTGGASQVLIKPQPWTAGYADVLTAHGFRPAGAGWLTRQL